MADKVAEPPKTRADEIPIEVAGRLLMISAERVRQLIKSGHIEKTRHGFTTIPSAVQGYIKFLKESASDRTTNAALSRAQDARAREVELRIKREERELIPLEEALLAMSMLCGLVSQQLTGLPARITRDMGLRRQIETETHAAQEAIATALDKLSGFVREGGDPPATLAKGNA
ncbi:MAG: hypothetical protein RL299_1250 [Pseudomonadota bacterium]|jgi:hypothetical protein